MAIAALWVLPIALLFIIFSRKNQDEKGQLLIDRQLDVANGLQEYLECIQEITAANQSKTYLDQLDQTIDRAEKAQIASELSSAVPVSTAQAFLKLGMASTILVGALLLASGEIDFMVYFCSVSYTHLDVYKRQVISSDSHSNSMYAWQAVPPSSCPSRLPTM